jgi:hypothetical protein
LVKREAQLQLVLRLELKDLRGQRLDSLKASQPEPKLPEPRKPAEASEELENNFLYYLVRFLIICMDFDEEIFKYNFKYNINILSNHFYPKILIFIFYKIIYSTLSFV